MTRKRMRVADADELGIRLEDIVGEPQAKPTSGSPPHFEKMLRQSLAGLTEKERKVLLLRFGMTEEQMLDLAQFADQSQADEAAGIPWWVKLLSPKLLGGSIPRTAERLALAYSRPQQKRTEHPPVLVWCRHCGCSYEWPWGRCVYVCERCGGHSMSAREPTGWRRDTW